MTKRGVRCKADNKSNRSRARSTSAVTAMGVLTIGVAVADFPAQASIPAHDRLGWIQRYDIPSGPMATGAQQIRIYERSAHRL